MMYVQVTAGVSIGGIASGHIIKRYEREHVKLAVTQPGHKTDYQLKQHETIQDHEHNIILHQHISVFIHLPHLA